ncbi:MAG: hypothetical protein NTY74_01355 [Ignavibacteriae bacterium]|nr:hypothetical protein [Ignavibacteriota bacterium]
MKKIFLGLFMLFTASLFAQSNDCGTERWGVKTLTDSNAYQVDFKHVVKSTVNEQAALDGHEIKADTPRLDDEMTVYRVRGYLIEFKTEADRDYHLVIMGEDKKITMVAEICDPKCPGVKKSAAYKKFVTVRNKFEKYFLKKKSKKNILVHVVIEGVAFFDKKHPVSPVGNAENNREIHPVTKITFLKK